MEESRTTKVMSDVEEQTRSWTKKERLRMVVEGKRMVEKLMAMEKVRHVLAINPKPLIIHEYEDDPLSITSMKHCQFGIDKIRKFQDNIHRDLDTKGYVLG